MLMQARATEVDVDLAYTEDFELSLIYFLKVIRSTDVLVQIDKTLLCFYSKLIVALSGLTSLGYF